MPVVGAELVHPDHHSGPVETIARAFLLKQAQIRKNINWHYSARNWRRRLALGDRLPQVLPAGDLLGHLSQRSACTEDFISARPFLPMAIQCPAGFDTHSLEQEVAAMYGRLAQDPNQAFHFHRGPDYAHSHLNYDACALRALPNRSTSVFAGVGNPHLIGPLEARSTVLDIGCGGGMDLLLAAQQVGPGGRAIGIDMTPAMLERAEASLKEINCTWAQLIRGDLHTLAVQDESVDYVISNGVLNLSTDKSRAFREILRVLRPGGYLQLADIVVTDELPEGVRQDPELWAA